MRVFITGASGWIGSAAVDELLATGHQVLGLARSDASAASLAAKGADVLRGDLDDLDSLRAGAADSEAVLHLANKHDWVNPAESNRAERVAVQTLLDALEGSGRRFMLASGVAGLASGRPSTERDASPFSGPDAMRGGTENLALDYLDRGVHALSARFAPTVHGMGDHGFIAILTQVAREKGVAGYIGEGTNRWAAVHRADAARVVRLGLEAAPAGSRLHAVGEEGVPTREIAGYIGAALGVPTTSIDPADAVAHFGVLGRFFGAEMSASSIRTQELLGWTPTGPTLGEDIAAGAYAS
ncbi:SDR family oxidoreductase [Microbacteriaceae bacterium VKM Ac-2855]|nr:SDR family oxidoreductase [Microbacteriaceae bacterium VKM Ac-2855]